MRYVLLLQGHRVSALALGRGVCDAPVVFDNSAEGRAGFTRYLQERLATLFTVVLDSKDEEHHLESMPCLRRHDHKLMLAKLRQRYFSADALSLVTTEKPRQRQRRDVPVTISGIGYGSDCECWLELLRTTSTLIVAMYSLPLLGVHIHRALGGAGGTCAVQLGHNDFRLMVFKHGRILISRHVSLAGRDLTVELLQQLDNTQSYLSRRVDVAGHGSGDSQGLSEADSVQNNPDKESVWVIGKMSADAKALLESNGVRVSSCHSVAKLLKLKYQLSSPFGESLFAALALVGNAREARYCSDVYRRGIKERRVRHLLFAGLFCCLGVTAAATAAAVRISHSYGALETTITRLSSESAMHRLEVSRQGNDLKVPVEAVRESMTLIRYLDNQARVTPQHFLYYFASGLSDYPELEVTAIHWSRVDSGYNKSTAIEIPAFNMTTAEATTYYTANVSGFIQTAEIPRLEVLSRFNRFIARLTESEHYTSVRVIEAPFGIAGETLSGRSVSSGSIAGGSMAGSRGQSAYKAPFTIALDGRDQVPL